MVAPALRAVLSAAAIAGAASLRHSSEVKGGAAKPKPTEEPSLDLDALVRLAKLSTSSSLSDFEATDSTKPKAAAEPTQKAAAEPARKATASAKPKPAAEPALKVKGGAAKPKPTEEPTLDVLLRMAKSANSTKPKSIWDSEDSMASMATNYVYKAMKVPQATHHLALGKANGTDGTNGTNGTRAPGAAARNYAARWAAVKAGILRKELKANQSNASAPSVNESAAAEAAVVVTTTPAVEEETTTPAPVAWYNIRRRDGTRLVGNFPTGAPPGGPAINASGGENVCKKIQFLAIQKTGTTTLYGHIMPFMAERQNQAWRTGHANYWLIADRGRVECAFTVLRDPVDRFLSEFTMARGVSGFELFGFQWDFHDDDLEWLEQVQKNPNVSEAMLEYLHSDRNPGRNRQTRYLLGFDRLSNSCRKYVYETKFYQKCPKEPSHPNRLYNWERDHDELLAIAKEHLLSLRAFGITDCFSESLHNIATAMGWDPDMSVEMLKGNRERNTQEDKRGLYLSWQTGLQKEFRQEDGVMTLAHFLTPELEDEIRRVNSMDVELVNFARQLLVERGLTTCNRK